MVTIEPFSESHLDLACKYASDKKISDSSNVPYSYTKEIADNWFKMISLRIESGKSNVFAIIFNDSFAGVISLNNINPEKHQAEIDYWIAVKYQGNGIATDAVSKLITYAYDSLGIKGIYQWNTEKKYRIPKDANEKRI